MRRSLLVSDEESTLQVPDVVGGWRSRVVGAGDEVRCSPVLAELDGLVGVASEDLLITSDPVTRAAGRLTSSPGLWKNSGERRSVTSERPMARL